jgi:hypothetical protein
MLLIVRLNIHLEKYQLSEDGYNAACYTVCYIADVSQYTSTKHVTVAQRFYCLMPYFTAVNQLTSRMSKNRAGWFRLSLF